MTVQRYFQQRAIKFDALYDESRGLHFINRILRRGMFERVRLTVDEMQGLKDFTVLDVGAGSGRNSVLFAEAGAKKVVGVDFSDPMIQLAQQFSRDNGKDAVCSFVQGDFLQHSFPEKFDVVVALGVFDYIEEPLTFLKRMASLANRKVIASFPEVSWPRSPLRKMRYAMRNCPLYFYQRHKLNKICQQAGFKQFRIVPYSSAGLLVVGEMSKSSEFAFELPKLQPATATAVNSKKFALFLKRMLDLLASSLTLLILSPIIFVLSILIWLKLGRPAIFRQERPGLSAKPFTLLKFRSMSDARDRDETLLPDAERLTGFGLWMRRYSLDELPQLWNVLKGEMSLVGPRPLLMQYLDRYTSEQAKRHLVKPGITGMAQVGGRNAITWEQKFELDVWYAEHWSLTLDLRILLQTMVQLFKRDGISQEGHATMPEFMGSRKNQ